MKITTNTVNVLKNFSAINPSLIITEGNVIKTISTSKTIMARAKVDSEFTKRCAIYNLNQFISVLSLFNDPELVFHNDHVDIIDSNKKSSYVYSSEDTLKVKPPEKDIVLPTIDVSFKLTNDNLKDVEKAAGVLGLPEIAVVGDGTVVTIQAVDSKNSTSHAFSAEIGNSDKVFRAIFKVDNIKVIPGDYEVNVCSRGISHFRGNEVEYWIAVEQNSTF